MNWEDITMGKKILLITTGGTIAQTKEESGIASNDSIKKATTLLSHIIDKKDAYNIDAIEPIDAFQIDSSNITPDHWKMMIDILKENYEEYHAFIITHGTNTLGYTCAALSFAMGQISKPIILTGSQVPYGDFGSDAETNLENAFRVAAQSRNTIKGVIAVFGSHIITGSRVKKTTEFEYDAFKTFNSRASLGRIGRVMRFDEESLKTHNGYYGTAMRSFELDIRSEFKMKNVISLTEFPGMNQTFFERLVKGGKRGENVEGIILRSTGAGDPNIGKEDDEFDNLRKAFIFLRENKIPIIVTTQAPDGIASMTVNKPGELARELGAVPAWDMSIESMTTKLAWLLAQDLPYDTIRGEMLKDYRGEISKRADVEEERSE